MFTAADASRVIRHCSWDANTQAPCLDFDDASWMEGRKLSEADCSETMVVLMGERPGVFPNAVGGCAPRTRTQRLSTSILGNP